MKKQGNKNLVWCFRASCHADPDNLDEQELEGWEMQGLLLPYCEAFAFQLESAPETGYLHFQGSFWLTNRNRKTFILKNIYAFEYLAPKSKNSTPKQCWSYGCKEDTRVLGPWLHGECPPDIERDRRQEWVDFIELSEASNFVEIKQRMPSKYVIYHNTMRRIANDTPRFPQDLDKRCGAWFWGPPNGGKSSFARSLGPFFIKHPNINWDGYQNQPIVIIEDLDESHAYILYHLKIWGDKYAFQGKILYSNVYIRPQRVIVTSNVQIHQVFTNPVHAEAIRSRFPETYFPHDPYFNLDPAARNDALRQLFLSQFVAPWNLQHPFRNVPVQPDAPPFVPD